MDARVQKDLLPYLDGAPVFDLRTELAQMRAAQPGASADLAVVQTEWFDAEFGGRRVRVKGYRGRGAADVPGGAPAVLWYHGGGYILGCVDGNDPICQMLAVQLETLGCRVFSVEYRLAPEHPHPAAVEDGYAALCWLSENSAALGVDPNCIVVAGASAGGGLAAAVTLMARDKNGPKIAFQMPMYAMLDDRNDTPSSLEINRETMPAMWNHEKNAVAWEMYLGGAKEAPSVYAAPAREENLRGLPPAYMCVGQLDPFRDENIRYMTRLAQAGVPVEFHLWPGCFHGFDAVFVKAPVSVQARQSYVGALRNFLEGRQRRAGERT